MNKKNLFRYGILLIFLLAFSIFSLRHMIFGGGVAPSVDAICPFGGFETLYTFFTTGNYVPRILISGLILAGGIVATVIFFKRGFCGWICPFGTIQELLGKITKKKINIPEKVDKYAKYTKYLVLIAILVATAVTATLVFRNYDPFITFFHFGQGVFWGNIDTTATAYIAFSILIAILLLSIFIERAWCRYFCPLGATISIFSWVGLSKINRDKKTCIDCKLCDKVCPSRVNVSTAQTVKDVECIDCMQCVDVCPKKSLSINIFGKKISKPFFVIALLGLFFGIISLSMATGVWQSVPSIDLKDTNGQVNADNIKGWMTLGNVSESVGIPIQVLCKDFNLPMTIDPNIPLKEIASKYNITFDTEMLRGYINSFDYSALQSQKTIECPWGIHDDAYPGQCGIYVDKNNDGICDLSE
jgi:NapH/MauN family ferredoxin-type protein